VTKRVSTTPSQPRPLPSRHRHIPELTCGFNNSNDVKSSGLSCEDGRVHVKWWKRATGFGLPRFAWLTRVHVADPGYTW